MPRPHIDQIRVLPDFPTMYQWNFRLSDPPKGVQNSDVDELNKRCLSSEIPKKTGQSIDIQVRGHHTKQPGIYDSTHTITVTFVETIDNYVANFLRSWRELCWEKKTGVQQSRADCTGTVVLEQLNRQDTGIWTYTLYGCWLEDYDPTGGTWDGTASEVLRPSLTLSYDWFDDVGA